MEPTLTQALFYHSWYSIWLPFIAGVVRFRWLSHGQRWIFALVSLGLLTELGSGYLAEMYGNNMALSHIYVALEGLLISEIFFRSYPSLISRKWLRSLQVGYVVFVIINGLFIQEMLAYNSYSRLMEALLMPPLAITFLAQVLRRLDVPRLERHPLFWVSIGILCYFSGNLLLFVYAEYVQGAGHEIFLAIWAIHGALMMLLYFSYFIALLCPRKVQPSQSFS